MVGGAARETIKTHEAVIQGVAGDYLPRVTTNIMWLIWAAHTRPTRRQTTTSSLKKTSTVENQHTRCNGKRLQNWGYPTGG